MVKQVKLDLKCEVSATTLSTSIIVASFNSYASHLGNASKKSREKREREEKKNADTHLARPVKVKVCKSAPSNSFLSKIPTGT